ncbi:MAG TPA: DUF1573 domain-containing protein [Gemmataceae bacterium]|jgi:hypothetical protein|nr:DUF1573 domain-containing protein [Gemmataceae bacterium]
MTRLLATCLTFGLFALPAAGDEQVPWANKFFTGKGGNAPPVIVHDFGTLPKGTVRTYRFPLTNIYQIPIQVAEPRPSCTCISVREYTAKMAPLETGFLEVEIDTRRVEGKKEVQLPVYFEGKDPKTNQPFWSWAKVEIRAVSRADITVSPGVVDFQVVPAGKPATQRVLVSYNGTQRDWKIQEAGRKEEMFDLKVEPIEGRGARVAYQITATLKPTAPPGAFNEVISLKTNDRNSPVLNLNVTGTVQSPLSVVLGDKVKMGPVKVGEKLSRQVSLQADKDFRVTAVDGQGDGVAAFYIASKKANKVQGISVEFAPEAPGPIKRVLTIHTDIGESVKVTVEGSGVEADAKAEGPTGGRPEPKPTVRGAVKE